MMMRSAVEMFKRIKKACEPDNPRSQFCQDCKGIVEDVLRMNMGYLSVEVLAMLDEADESNQELVQKPLLTYGSLAQEVCDALGPATVAIIPVAVDEQTWEVSAKLVEEMLWNRGFFHL